MFAPLLTSRGKYRHVVFADELGGPRRAVNLAPLPATVAPRASGEVQPALSHEEREFVEGLFSCVGVDAGAYREQTLSRRLSACLRVLRVGSVAEASATLRSQPRLAQAAIDAMMIGVTSFFRDRDVFDHLDHYVLPLLHRRGEKLRACSAGCSDGAELYSLAMLLARRGWLGEAELLGTDCRRSALRQAEVGWYSDAAVAPIPRDLFELHFEASESGGARVREPLRTRLQWRVQNILTGMPEGAWDLIVCRNLGMYLNGASAARLWERLGHALRPGGVLVLGKAERPCGDQFVAFLPCIYRRERE